MIGVEISEIFFQQNIPLILRVKPDQGPGTNLVKTGTGVEPDNSSPGSYGRGTREGGGSPPQSIEPEQD